MFFALSLSGMIVASIMCWITGSRRMVVVSWIIWVIGFVALPKFFGTAWPILALQGVLALALLFRWKINDLT